MLHELTRALEWGFGLTVGHWLANIFITCLEVGFVVGVLYLILRWLRR